MLVCVSSRLKHALSTRRCRHNCKPCSACRTNKCNLDETETVCGMSQQPHESDECQCSMHAPRPPLTHYKHALSAEQRHGRLGRGSSTKAHVTVARRLRTRSRDGHSKGCRSVGSSFTPRSRFFWCVFFVDHVRACRAALGPGHALSLSRKLA